MIEATIRRLVDGVARKKPVTLTHHEAKELLSKIDALAEHIRSYGLPVDENYKKAAFERLAVLSGLSEHVPGAAPASYCPHGRRNPGQCPHCLGVNSKGDRRE